MTSNARRAERPKAAAKAQRRKASALLSVIAISAIILVSVSTLMSYGQAQRENITRLEIRQRETAMAENVIDSIAARIGFFRDNRPAGVGNSYIAFHNMVLNDIEIEPGYLPAEYELMAYTIESLTGATPTFSVIDDPNDDFDGFSSLTMDYKITARVRSIEGNAARRLSPGVQITRTARMRVIPLYQFAIFYENTLELDAGARIDLYGKVHTNGDFYLTTSSQAYYWKGASVGGDFYSGIYEPHTGRGNTNSDSIYVTRNGVNDDYANVPWLKGTNASSNQWLDNRYSNWVDEAYERYGRYLRDQAHGVLPIQLPLPDGFPPRVTIDRAQPDDPPAVAAARFENQAAIKIEGDPYQIVSNGWTPTQAVANGALIITDADGNTIPPTYTDAGGTTRNWVTTEYLYNGREEKTVYVFDVDAGALGVGLGNGSIVAPTWDNQGVVYVAPTQPASSSRQAGARLSNGRILPVDDYNSFTFATYAPVYTKGDMNKPADPSDRALAIVAGDAINLLSNAFNDSQYHSGSGNGPKKTASNTETNLIYMGGNTPSDDPAYYGRYSGGAENYFRYLESWSGKDHVFHGSIMNLWKSEIATASWDKNPTPGQQSSGYYSAPRRKWYWDEANQTTFPPPHFPSFWVFEMRDWGFEKPTLE